LNMIGVELKRHFSFNHHSLMVWLPGLNAASLHVHCNKSQLRPIQDDGMSHLARSHIKL
jgi:hypothetical protein